MHCLLRVCVIYRYPDALVHSVRLADTVYTRTMAIVR